MKNIAKLLFLILLPFLVGISMPVQNNASGDDFHNPIYPDFLDGTFTGGFGEETCRSCHFDYDLNMDGGSLSVQGLDKPYEPGAEIPVTVTVESEQLEIGGFQMSARHEDGSQAGSFEWDGDRLMFTPEVSGDIQYLQHSKQGTEPTNKREVSWSFTWIAPETGKPVIFNVAANAGNYDDSSFGDWIYATEMRVTPSGNQE